MSLYNLNKIRTLLYYKTLKLYVHTVLIMQIKNYFLSAYVILQSAGFQIVALLAGMPEREGLAGERTVSSDPAEQAGFVYIRQEQADCTWSAGKMADSIRTVDIVCLSAVLLSVVVKEILERTNCQL